MNRLSTAERARVINCLIEGCSLRSTVRLTGVAKKTVSRILVETGEACAAYHDKIMRNLPCKVIQVDEIWSFTYCKQANIPEHLQGQDGVGDTWTWIAIDADTKLIPSWHVGLRDATAAYAFIHDLKDRLANRKGVSPRIRRVFGVVRGSIRLDSFCPLRVLIWPDDRCFIW